jgi:hypothetical protein
MSLPPRSFRKSVIALVSLFFLASALLYAGAGGITSFTIPGATYVDTTGINAAGTIIGLWIDRQNVRHGYILNSVTGIITVVDEPDAGTQSNDGTFIYGINDLGQTTGGYNNANSSGVIESHGFFRDQYGNYTSFDAPGAVTSAGVGINASGVIAGSYSPNQGGNIYGFIRDVSGNITDFSVPDSIYTGVVAINSVAQIIGNYTVDNSNYYGFIRQPSGSLITFKVPHAFQTYPQAINDAGTMTGYHGDRPGADAAKHGFFRDNLGNITSFDAPGAGTEETEGTYPLGINDAGDITGYYVDSNAVAHGFVRNQAGSFIELDDPNAGTRQNKGTFPCCINKSGQIAGEFTPAKGEPRGFIRK